MLKFSSEIIIPTAISKSKAPTKKEYSVSVADAGL